VGPRNRCGDDKVWKLLHNFVMPEEQRIYAVYILASKKNGTLYIGVTGDLPTRITQHKEGLVEGFTKRHGAKTLVWYETFDLVELAIEREKTMKKWP